MSTIIVEDTVTHLTGEIRRWDRRLRLVHSVLWGPRGLIFGLLFGVVIAGVSRLRPWLLPEQIALAAVGAVLVIGLGVLAVIWLWPRPAARAARYFDRRFDLKERMSTALELSRGLIPMSEQLGERQLTDAMSVAQRVNAAHRLPARVRIREIVIVVVLAVVLAILLLTHNPKSSELRAKRGLQTAINNQSAAIDEEIQAIEQNDSLTPEEKEALTEPLKETKEILEQPDVSQPEAMAALSEAEQTLEEYSDGIPPEQDGAYQEAADSLSDSDLTSDLSNAMEEPDLGASAEALDQMADQIEQDRLSETDRQELAQQLEEAAQALEGTNPQLAEKLREAADALREGDNQRAEEALREAAQQMREQQKQAEDSQLAESAEEAAKRLDEAKQELAQAGQQSDQQRTEQQQSGENQQQSGENQQQSGESDQGQQQQSGQEQQSGQGQESQQQGEQGDPQSAQQGEQQPAQSGQEGESVQEGESQENGQMAPGDQSSQSQGQQAQSETAGENTGENQPGSQAGSQSGDSQQGSINQSGEPGENASVAQIEGAAASSMGAPSAGEGQGGAGTDTISGIPDTTNQEISTNNTPGDREGGPLSYSAQSSSATIGGDGGDDLDVGGEPSTTEGVPVQEGEFGENPTGESVRSYTSVYDNYQGVVSDALESGRIPLDQRDVIHDYFSSLEP
jgi:hypothetical protein